MFTGGEHKFKVYEHVFKGGEHKFTVRGQKNCRINIKDSEELIHITYRFGPLRLVFRGRKLPLVGNLIA